LIEEFVLFHLESDDPFDDLVPMTGERPARSLRVAVIDVSERGLGHERTNSGVIGDVGEVSKLLVGQRKFAAQLHELPTDRPQATLLEHAAQSRDSNDGTSIVVGASIIVGQAD
jgi:hypothetical protein